MGKVLVLVLVICLIPLSGALCSGHLGVGLDAGCIQDAILGNGSLQIGLDLRTMVSDSFQVRIPIAFTINKASYMWETGLSLVYYPWLSGPFMSLSVFQVGFSQGTEDMDNLVNLNEVQIGWTYEFGPGFFIEPSLVIRDPSGTFSDEYSRIKGAFPCYTTFRGRLTFGWFFWR